MSSDKHPTDGYWVPVASEYRAAQCGARAPRMDALGVAEGQ